MEQAGKIGKRGREEERVFFLASPLIALAALQNNTQKKRTEQYSNSPSNTGQSASPTLPMLNRRICVRNSSWLSGVTAFKNLT